MKEIGQEGWHTSPVNRTEEDIKKARKREEEFNKHNQNPNGDIIIKRMGFDLYKGDKE